MTRSALTLEDLRQSVAADDLARVNAILQSGLDPNERNKQDVAPLLLAALLNRTAIAQALIRHGAEYPDHGSDAELDRYRSKPNATLCDAIESAIHFRNRKLFEALLEMPSAITSFGALRTNSIAWRAAVTEARRDKQWFLHEIIIACAADALGIRNNSRELQMARQALNAFIKSVEFDEDSYCSRDHFDFGRPFIRSASTRFAENSSLTGVENEDIRAIKVKVFATPRSYTYSPLEQDTNFVESLENHILWEDRNSQDYDQRNTLFRHRIDDTTLVDYTLFSSTETDGFCSTENLIHGTLFYSSTKQSMDTFIASRPSLDVMNDLIAAIDENDADKFISAIDRGADLRLEGCSPNDAATLTAHYGAHRVLQGLVERRPAVAKDFVQPISSRIKAPLVVAIKQIDHFEHPDRSCEKYAQILIEHGADLTMIYDEDSPLTAACKGTHTDILAKLLDAGADHTTLSDLSQYENAVQSMVGAWRARSAVQTVLNAAKERASASAS